MVVEIEQIDRDFSVCKVADYSYADLNTAFCFVGKTDEENPWYVLQAMSRPMRQTVRTAGKPFASGGSWISH